MKTSARLTRKFYRRSPEILARALLGQELVRRLEDGRELSGRIVEVEAYLGAEDQAAHSFGGKRTKRNESMWIDGGHAYVYFVYGMHWCFNVVADRAGMPTACLIRALEPLEGIEEMRRRRADKKPSMRLHDTDLCSGPAKLTQALGIDGDFDGLDLTSSDRLFLRRRRSVPPQKVAVAPRIGVSYAGAWADEPLRFYVCNHRHLSRRSSS